MTTWVYQQSEPGLWTVGFYDPEGKWHTDMDGTQAECRQRVMELNGGAGSKPNAERRPNTIYRPFTLTVRKEAEYTLWKLCFRLAEALECIPDRDMEVSEGHRTITVKTVNVSELPFALLPFARHFEDTGPNMAAQGINVFFWRIEAGKLEVTTGHAEPDASGWEEAE